MHLKNNISCANILVHFNVCGKTTSISFVCLCISHLSSSLYIYAAYDIDIDPNGIDFTHTYIYVCSVYV